MDPYRKPGAHVGEPRTAVVLMPGDNPPQEVWTGYPCCACGARPANFYTVSGDSPEVRPHCRACYDKAGGSHD